eukprot:snap_masked-scaffold_53-processed-gene-1.85-mRNA-1 protein AED:1.00 eAED:1.00 QI:0/-1/0/0/-1/1/1/0/712
MNTSSTRNFEEERKLVRDLNIPCTKYSKSSFRSIKLKLKKKRRNFLEKLDQIDRELESHHLDYTSRLTKGLSEINSIIERFGENINEEASFFQKIEEFKEQKIRYTNSCTDLQEDVASLVSKLKISRNLQTRKIKEILSNGEKELILIGFSDKKNIIAIVKNKKNTWLKDHQTEIDVFKHLIVALKEKTSERLNQIKKAIDNLRMIWLEKNFKSTLETQELLLLQLIEKNDIVSSVSTIFQKQQKSFVKIRTLLCKSFIGHVKSSSSLNILIPHLRKMKQEILEVQTQEKLFLDEEIISLSQQKQQIKQILHKVLLETLYLLSKYQELSSYDETLTLHSILFEQSKIPDNHFNFLDGINKTNILEELQEKQKEKVDEKKLVSHDILLTFEQIEQHLVPIALECLKKIEQFDEVFQDHIKWVRKILKAIAFKFFNGLLRDIETLTKMNNKKNTLEENLEEETEELRKQLKEENDSINENIKEIIIVRLPACSTENDVAILKESAEKAVKKAKSCYEQTVETYNSRISTAEETERQLDTKTTEIQKLFMKKLSEQRDYIQSLKNADQKTLLFEFDHVHFLGKCEEVLEHFEKQVTTICKSSENENPNGEIYPVKKNITNANFERLNINLDLLFSMQFQKKILEIKTFAALYLRHLEHQESIPTTKANQYSKILLNKNFVRFHKRNSNFSKCMFETLALYNEEILSLNVNAQNKN